MEIAARFRPQALAVAFVSVGLLANCNSGPNENIANHGAITTVIYGDTKYAIPTVFTSQIAYVRPEIDATYPDFRPAALVGPPCVGWFASKTVPKCSKFEFWIQDGTTIPHQRTGVDRPLPNIDPTIHLGPGPHVPLIIDFTRKLGVGFCTLTRRADGMEDGVCSEHLLLTNGDYANFLFPYHLRNRLPSIEAGIGALAMALAAQ